MALPDAGNVEDYSEEEMTELLGKFATDKGSLTKKQMAAVARYNFKKGKGDPIVYRGQAPAPAAPVAPAPAPAAAGVSVSADIVALLPDDMKALAAKDPASLSKDEKIALAKAKSQAVKAQQAAKDAGAAAPPAADADPNAPKPPTPEEVARGKALAFAHAAKLDGKFGPAIASWSMQVDKPYATVEAGRILDVVRYLHMEMGFTYLRNLTAVDFHPSHLEVEYNVFNMEKREHLALRVKLPRDAPAGMDMPSLPSVVSIHPGADWLEREVFDLFGIRFLGHPYMRRLMLPDDWVGHPLRKDYDGKKEQFVGLGADGKDIVTFNKEDGW